MPSDERNTISTDSFVYNYAQAFQYVRFFFFCEKVRPSGKNQ
jgi:hypothetical protein